MLTNRPLQGLLYAVGGSLPKHLQHGATCQAKVEIFDMARLVHHGSVDFWIDRLAFSSKDAPQKVQSPADMAAGSPTSAILSAANPQELGDLGVQESR